MKWPFVPPYPKLLTLTRRTGICSGNDCGSEGTLTFQFFQSTIDKKVSRRRGLLSLDSKGALTLWVWIYQASSWWDYAVLYGQHGFDDC